MSENGSNSPSAPLLSVPEAARYLGVGRRVVYSLIERGDLPVLRTRGRTLIKKENLDEFKASGKLT